MTTYGIVNAITDGKQETEFGREVLAIYSGPFFSLYEARAVALPKGDGYIITIPVLGEKVRVTCPTPRTDSNFQVIDAQINAALNAAYPDTAEVLA